MYTLVIIVHVIVSFALISIVLLQQGKGGDIGSVFGGGGSNPLMGSRGAASFIGKVTAGCAMIFMVTSLYLTIQSRKTAGESLLEKAAQEEAGRMQSQPMQPPANTPVMPVMPETVTPLTNAK